MTDTKVPHVDIYVVFDGIGRLAAAKPGIYSREDGQSSCVNTEIVNGERKPSCIVGSFLAEIVGLENVPSYGSAEGSVNELVDNELMTIDEDARFALTTAQRLQDTRKITWEAVSIVLPELVNAGRSFAARTK